MFCPECKAEYRVGFTRCADCDVDLVANLPEAKAESSDRSNLQGDRSNLREVWTGDEQERCVDTCLILKDAGIPYEVTQRQTQFLQEAEAHFKIAVPSSFYKQAKEVTGPDTDDFSDDPGDHAIIELPDCRCSKIMSPLNCNETLSPCEDGDNESEGVSTGESD